MGAVISCKANLEVKADELKKDFCDLSTSLWNEETSVKNLRRMNDLVIEWHKNTSDIKSVEVLASVDQNIFPRLEALYKFILSCVGRISSFEVFLSHYNSLGSKKDTMVQFYSSVHSIHQSAKVMLEKSF